MTTEDLKARKWLAEGRQLEKFALADGHTLLGTDMRGAAGLTVFFNFISPHEILMLRVTAGKADAPRTFDSAFFRAVPDDAADARLLRDWQDRLETLGGDPASPPRADESAARQEGLSQYHC